MRACRRPASLRERPEEDNPGYTKIRIRKMPDLQRLRNKKRGRFYFLTPGRERKNRTVPFFYTGYTECVLADGKFHCVKDPKKIIQDIRKYGYENA